MRITFNNLKQWVNESSIDLGINLEARSWNGCYHIMFKDTGNILATGTTAKEAWELFSMWKSGYHYAKEHK